MRFHTESYFRGGYFEVRIGIEKSLDSESDSCRDILDSILMETFGLSERGMFWRMILLDSILGG